MTSPPPPAEGGEAEGAIEREITARLAAVDRRIAAACERVGRRPEQVTLVGASKKQPLARVRAAIAAGLRVLGENRVQEAVEKSSRLDASVDWHLIGPLQSNKVKAAARLFSTVHSVDRIKIARLLDREARRLARTLTGFVQVHLGAEPSKHGFPEERLAETIAPLAKLEGLRLVGLMAIPPYEEDLERARLWFRRLRRLRDALGERREWRGWPGWLSMGMSHDFEVAIEEGATHVRVGTALFGRRREGVVH